MEVFSETTNKTELTLSEVRSLIDTFLYPIIESLISGDIPTVRWNTKCLKIGIS
jgi:hypothetical protein